MTLIGAFRTHGGAVIVADSQETVKDEHGDEWKYSVLKIRPETIGKFQIVIAGGGNAEAIDSFIERFKRKANRGTQRILSQF